MPFTFFAHQAFVLPLKWAWPRRFDGTALCAGSMAPDLAYALEGTPLAFPSHTLAAQLGWSLPVATLLALLWRHLLAEPCGASLPGRIGEPIRALALSRRPLWLTASSTLLGALSHVFVDGFTHPGGWAEQRIGLLRQEISGLPGMLDGLTVAKSLQYAGHLLGTPLGAMMLAAMLWARRPGACNGLPPPARGAPGLLWGALLAGVLLSVPAAASVAWTGGGVPAAVMRAAWTVGLGVAVAGGAVRQRG